MKPIVLTILDGVGLSNLEEGNAPKLAATPTLDYLMKIYPNSRLIASGKEVGLPEGQMGNSEVGHLNISAGRVVNQSYQIINNSIKKGSFFRDEDFLQVFNHVNDNNSRLHIMGLLSDGGIHSHINHILSLLELAKEHGIKEIYIHAITDGRDTFPNESLKYLDILNEKINKIRTGKIATISGRYYTMDRDNNWQRIEKAYRAIIDGEGLKFANYQEAIEYNFNQGIYDEFIIPSIIEEEGMIKENDGIIWANFRPDRARQILKAITNNEFDEFSATSFSNINLVTLMPVSNEVSKNVVAIEGLDITNSLGEYISKKGLNQLRLSETVKFPHVTFFFDGGKRLKLEKCDQILVPTPKVATFDLKPEMASREITDELLKAIDSDYDLIVVNYPNGDMVGHTGILEAAIKGMEAIDACLNEVYTKVKAKEGLMLITADHGNCEEMIDEDGKTLTRHSTNLVPFIITNKKYKIKDGKLANIAPTILELLNIEKPKEMTESSLLIK